MEGYDAFEGDRSSRRRRHKRHSSPAYEDDWTRTYYPPVHSPPRRRAQEEIHRPDHHRRESVHYGRPFATRAPLSSSSSSRAPRAAMPLLMRSSTAPNRRSTYDAWNSNSYDDDLSHSDSRRSSSRRDMSPPSHQYRSTPDSRRSSPRTSVCDSEGETELTASTQDNRGRGKGVDIIPDKEVLADRLRPRSKRRRRRTRREDVIFEEELDDRNLESRPPPSLDRHRSPSRHSSDRHHHCHHHTSHQHRHRAPTEEDDPRPRSSSRRSSSRYYESEIRYSEKPALLRRSNTTGGTHDTQTVSSSRRFSKRSSNLLKGFFGLSHQHSRPSTRKPVKHVECVVCMDDLPLQKVAKLRCGHSMCHSCLKRSFKLSITDPQHMPPRCCTKDLIPLKHVDRLFNTQFKKTWNDKYREHTTRDRVYCPSRKCGEWIRPEDIHRDEGRKYARCHHCNTKICCLCSGRWHTARECPRDEETNQILRQAKQEGWQRCHKCKTLVELKDGCNHMTCRCGAEFCMICGNKWKTCTCQWFTYDNAENDRIGHMQIPMDMRANPLGPMPMPPREQMPMQQPPFAPVPMATTHAHAHTPTHAPPHISPHVPLHVYEDDMRRRVPQEHGDEMLARRLQAVPLDDDYRGGVGDVTGMAANQAGPFMNEDYRRGPMNPLAPAAPTPPPAAAPPMHHPVALERSNSATDYISGVNKARGVFAPGMERRLADRFNTEPRTSPTHRHAPAAFGPAQPPPGAMLHTQPSMSALPMQPMPSMPSMPSMQSMSMPPMSMPTAPVPPPAVPGYPLSPRRHSVANPEHYDSPRQHRPRSSERPSGSYSRRRDIYEEDASDVEEERERERERTPSRSRRRHHHRHRQHQREEPEVKSSMLAGLTGPGAGMNRVFEWRNHVEPGPPEEGQQQAASTRS